MSEKTEGLDYLCIDCFHKKYFNRALGLTTKEAQLCYRCNKLSICVMEWTVKTQKEKK